MLNCKKCGNSHNGNFGSGVFCSRSCANSRTKSSKTKDKVSVSMKLYNSKNPRKKKEILLEKVNCLNCGIEFEKTLDSTKLYCSQKCGCSSNGGYREGSGRGKSGWYKGYYCDSLWELAFVIYNLENDIKFIRNTEKFNYVFNGKNKNYIPDFILDGIYYEIKGYKSGEWLAKLAQFTKPIKVLYKKQMEIYFNYVKSKYGQDYIYLYDNYKPSFEYKCDCCSSIFTTKKEKKTEIKYCSRLCAGKGTNIGKVWIHNLQLKVSKKIKKEELQTYEDLGWIKGRKMKFV